MTDKEKLEKIKALADKMYSRMAYLTSDTRPIRQAMDEYHQFIINEYHKEELVSEDLEKEIDRAHRIFYDEVGWDSDEGARAYVADWFAHYFANWQKHHMEVNRIKHCNSISKEQYELEQKFLDEHLDKHDRMPTFLDAIEYGMRLQKEQMMKGAFEFAQKHNDACVLASECLRNNGWFNREHDFNDLFLYLSCVDELFAGKFSGKTKVIVIED